MIQSIDHIVILVRNLEEAIADYTALGFTVTPGGVHADGATHNALVPFDDGSYLELIAFTVREVVNDVVLSYQAGPSLQEGALQIVLEAFEEPPLPIHVLYPEGRQAPAKVRAFVDLAVARLRGNPLFS